MQLRSFLALGALASLLIPFTTGCSSVQKGAAAGGAVGATAGALIGNNVAGGQMAQGALLGGGAGVATGGLAGDAFEQVNESDMERELENLRAQLSEREAELAALQNAGPSDATMEELASLRSELDATRQKLAAAGQADQDLSKLRAELNSLKNGKDATVRGLEDKLNKANQENASLMNEIKDLKADYETANADRARFEKELSAARDDLRGLRDELSVIEATLREKDQAVENLRQEMEELNIELEETSRGLTLTIVDQLLFTPGKAQLSDDGAELIAKVAEILRTNFKDREFVVEGHTDNQPIVHSGWRSNWELGAGRALTVVHELVDIHGFTPDQLSATTYGQHRPTADNASSEGRAQNRRSVIVILPEKIEVKKAEYASVE